MADEPENKSWLAGALFYLVSAALVVSALVLVSRIKGARARQVAAELRSERAAVQAGPRVNVVTVASGPGRRSLTLLGETHAYLQSTLYAKISGYLKAIYVDKGDNVTANQVLAVIESPETDAQYRAAVINAHNLELIAQRDLNLVKRDMVAKQDADTAVASAHMAEQTVANLATLKSYEIIRAPFTGKITARYADPGALLQAATSSETAALPLVRISETDRERVYIYPDQSEAAYIRVGEPAWISDPTRPNVRVAARVTRISGEFDPSTRTMLTEIDFYNRRNLIPPGSFVRVTLRLLKSDLPDARIPAAALVLRGSKILVGVIGPDNRVTLHRVVVSTDDGVYATIRSGLRPGETVAVNLGDGVADGSKIQPIRHAGTSP